LVGLVAIVLALTYEKSSLATKVKLGLLCACASVAVGALDNESALYSVLLKFTAPAPPKYPPRKKSPAELDRSEPPEVPISIVSVPVPDVFL